MEVFWTIIIVILLIMFMANRFVKAAQKVQSHDRCRYCRARLRFMGVGKSGQAGIKAGYATVCAKCGREQPWANTPKSRTLAGRPDQMVTCPSCGWKVAGGRPCWNPNCPSKRR
jgi:DNA-directed RNA polymerase subunit RPC12/RpoP